MSGNSINLLISIEEEILLGCYDMLSVYGGDLTDGNMEVVVSEVLKSLIRGLRDDKFIPTYETSIEILERLQAVFPNQALTLKPDHAAGPITVIPEVLQGVADDVQRAIEKGKGNFDSIREETDVAALPMEKEGGGTTGKEEETSLSFSQLPGDDPLVKEATGDKPKEEALVEIYSKITQELWGTDRARKMWETTLEFKKSELEKLL